MENHNKLNRNNKRVFPKDTPDIIESLLEEYRLETIKELFESFGPIKTFKERKEFQERWENLPGPHIAKILKEVSQGKIRNEDVFIATLQERLNISKETAQKLAKDLEEKVLSLAQITFREKKEIPSTKEIKETKPAPPQRKDTYREPIE